MAPTRRPYGPLGCSPAPTRVRPFKLTAHDVYGKSTCDTTAYFESYMAPITKGVPLIWGETRQTYDDSDGGSSYISAMVGWADTHGLGYEAWTWDRWPNCESLVANYNGTVYSSGYARWVKAHYAAF